MRAGLSVPFFGVLAGFLLFVLVLHSGPVDDSRALHVLSPRQVTASVGNTPATSQAQSSQAAAASSTPAASSSQQQQQQPTSTSTPPTSAAQQATSQTTQTTNTPSNVESKSTTPAPSVTSAVVTTNSGGQVVTSVVVVHDPSSSSSAAASPTSGSSSKSSGESSGIGTSTIIGLSVAGGVAVLCIAAFFIWKLTRKRLGDFDNNEEIKWPELNTHDTSVPLPTNRTGGAGFDTGPEATRRSSVGYAPSTAANSTAELYPDPYAVPPLPHLDPNQPYHDDPNTRFYDPYRGPIPPSFEQTTQGGEAIPMTQLAGRRSPGPAAAFGGGNVGSGRTSPGPYAAFNAAVDVGGRSSPAPPAAYGADYGGRASPGPRTPYAGGRMSPGPQAAYGSAYGPR